MGDIYLLVSFLGKNEPRRAIIDEIQECLFDYFRKMCPPMDRMDLKPSEPYYFNDRLWDSFGWSPGGKLLLRQMVLDALPPLPEDILNLLRGMGIVSAKHHPQPKTAIVLYARSSTPGDTGLKAAFPQVIKTIQALSGLTQERSWPWPWGEDVVLHIVVEAISSFLFSIDDRLGMEVVRKLPEHYQKTMVFCTSPDRSIRRSEEIDALCSLPGCKFFYLRDNKWRDVSVDAEAVREVLDQERNISTHSICQWERKMLSKIITTCPNDGQVYWVRRHTHQLIRDGGYTSLVLLSTTARHKAHSRGDRRKWDYHEAHQTFMSALVNGLNIRRYRVRLVDFSPSGGDQAFQALNNSLPGTGNKQELVVLLHLDQVARTKKALCQFIRAIGHRDVMILTHSAPSQKHWRKLENLACTEERNSSRRNWAKGIEPQKGFGELHSIICPVVVIQNGNLVESYQSIKKNSFKISAAHSKARTAASRRKVPQSFKQHRNYPDSGFRNKWAQEILEAVTGVTFRLHLLDGQKKCQSTVTCRQDGENSTECSCSPLSGCRLARGQGQKPDRSLKSQSRFQLSSLQPPSYSSYDLSVIRTKLQDIRHVTEVKERKQLTNLVTCRILRKLVPLQTPQDRELRERAWRLPEKISWSRDKVSRAFDGSFPNGFNQIEHHCVRKRRDFDKQLLCTLQAIRDALVYQFSNLGLRDVPQELFYELEVIAKNKQGAANWHFQRAPYDLWGFSLLVLNEWLYRRYICPVHLGLWGLGGTMAVLDDGATDQYLAERNVIWIVKTGDEECPCRGLCPEVEEACCDSERRTSQTLVASRTRGPTISAYAA